MGCQFLWTVGNSTTVKKVLPTMVPGLGGSIGIAAGDNYTVAWKMDRSVYAWGQNNAGQLGDGTTSQKVSPTLLFAIYNVITIAAGGQHAVAVLQNGTVYAWDSNGAGQLGDDRTF